ncbi:MAG: PAS domain S-box protein, partial [Candidatus Peribacteraceae bacterium]|nr:PAS domain S-box protein [Candidatus Peribacteraceae bacterium]
MNKRTQLRAGMIVTTTLITIFICMVFYCVVVVSRSYKQQKISEKMAELSFQLSLLQSEFVQFSGERPKSQWASVYASLQIILDDYPRSELSQTQELLFKEIREATMQQKNLFEELVRNVDEGGNATIIRELNNQLSVIAQTGTTNALELAELGRQQAEHATRWLSFVIVVLGLLVLGVSVGSYLLSDAIASSLLSATLFLDAIIENIPHMIFLKDAKELRFVRFNRAGEKLLGYDRKDLIGKNDYDFFPKGQADAFTQKDHKVLQSGKLTDIPCEAIDTRENGKRFLHTKKIAIRDAEGKPQFLLGISEDITERMVQEEDLRKYKQAVMSSSDGIIITDPQSIILFVNPAWTHLNGYCAAEVVGKSVSILKTEKTSQKIYANLRKAMHVGEAFHSDDFVNRRKDGSEYNADLTIYPVRKEEEEEEEVLYWVGILADVTSRKTSETAKTEFISLASHQLRT